MDTFPEPAGNMHRLKLCRSGNYGCGCSRNNRCRHDNNRVNRRERNSNGKMRTSNLNRLLRHTAPHRFLLLCLPFTASCSEGSVPEPCAELPTRTVLVYLAGDNNLEEIGRTPELLRQGWKDTGSKCLIYYDAPQAAPKLFALTIRHSDASSVLETVEEYPEENSSSAGVFGRVLADVVRKYPSDSYGLIFASARKRMASVRCAFRPDTHDRRRPNSRNNGWGKGNGDHRLCSGNPRPPIRFHYFRGMPDVGNRSSL